MDGVGARGYLSGKNKMKAECAFMTTKKQIHNTL